MFNKIKRRFISPRGQNKSVIPVPTSKGFSWIPMFCLEDFEFNSTYKVCIGNRCICEAYIKEVKANDYWEAMRLTLYDLQPGETIVYIREM